MELNLQQEKELVKKAQEDPAAFSALYEQNYSKIFGYVLRRVANLAITQDVVSETFLKAFESIGSFRWKNISFSSWLYRIASHEIANYFRKNKYTPLHLEMIKEPIAVSNPLQEYLEAEEELKQKKDFMKIQEKITHLPLHYQEVISLRFFEEKKIQEIAEILGKKEGTIKSLLHRGLEQLRQLME